MENAKPITEAQVEKALSVLNAYATQKSNSIEDSIPKVRAYINHKLPSDTAAIPRNLKNIKEALVDFRSRKQSLMQKRADFNRHFKEIPKIVEASFRKVIKVIEDRIVQGERMATTAKHIHDAEAIEKRRKEMIKVEKEKFDVAEQARKKFEMIQREKAKRLHNHPPALVTEKSDAIATAEIQAAKEKLIHLEKESSRLLHTPLDKAAATGRLKWEYKVINAERIPREFLMPNDVLIKQTIAKNIQIPGIQARQVEKF